MTAIIPKTWKTGKNVQMTAITSLGQNIAQCSPVAEKFKVSRNDNL